MTDELVDRFSRQADLVPQGRLKSLTASVIGVGAIGRQVALQLAAIGVRHLKLIDFDVVDPSNVTTQAYHRQDVGRAKVEATAEAVARIESTIGVECFNCRFHPRLDVGEAVFACVDSIQCRQAIWRALEHRCSFWIDARMLGEVIRVLAADDLAGRLYYPTTLFAAAEGQLGSCMAKSTVYAAAIAAGLAVHQFTRWLRGIQIDRDLSVNLLAAEMTPL